jgi:hypothetical protein
MPAIDQRTVRGGENGAILANIDLTRELPDDAG